MVEGAGKAQMQVVGLLGLISLFTMNNAYWIAAILLAAIRIPDIVTPLKDIARARSSAAEIPPVEPEPIVSDPVEAGPVEASEEEIAK